MYLKDVLLNVLKIVKSKDFKTVIPTKQADIEPNNTNKLFDYLELNIFLRQD